MQLTLNINVSHKNFNLLSIDSESKNIILLGTVSMFYIIFVLFFFKLKTEIYFYTMFLSSKV